MRHLFLRRMANTNHRLLNLIGRIFAHIKPRLRRHQQGNAARLAQLQRARTILVHKCILDSRRIRRKTGYNIGELLMHGQEPQRQILALALANTIAKVRNTTALHVNHAPAHISKPRIYPDYTHAPCLFTHILSFLHQ
jgi:hypothetical protein